MQNLTLFWDLICDMKVKINLLKKGASVFKCDAVCYVLPGWPQSWSCCGRRTWLKRWGGVGGQRRRTATVEWGAACGRRRWDLAAGTTAAGTPRGWCEEGSWTRGWEGQESLHFVFEPTFSLLNQEVCLQVLCTWSLRLKGVRTSCWRPSWSASCWCTPPESWARCGSSSAGRCWRLTAGRWTAPSSCSDGESAEGWRTATLDTKRHSRDDVRHLSISKNDF